MSDHSRPASFFFSGRYPPRPPAPPPPRVLIFFLFFLQSSLVVSLSLSEFAVWHTSQFQEDDHPSLPLEITLFKRGSRWRKSPSASSVSACCLPNTLHTASANLLPNFLSDGSERTKQVLHFLPGLLSDTLPSSCWPCPVI